jgi:predicted TIM-barrel fold metal-dependent hydrolase
MRTHRSTGAVAQLPARARSAYPTLSASLPDRPSSRSERLRPQVSTCATFPPMPVDMHAHFLPPALTDMLRERRYLPRIETAADGVELFHRPFGTTDFDPSYADIDLRVETLERLQIEFQLLSLPGLVGIDSLPVEESFPMVRVFNDALSEVLDRFPGRFYGLTALPMADIPAAAEELRRGMTTLGFIGAILPINCFANVAEARKLEPIFRVADELHAHLFIHPGRRPDEVVPMLESADTRPGWPGTLPLRALNVQTNIAYATVTLLYSAFLDDYANVTLHVANLGGTYPMVEERIENLSKVRNPGLPLANERARKIYADCGSLGPEAIEMAVKVFGADRILLGSDTPTFRPEWAISAIREAVIAEEDKVAILQDNALALLRRHRSPARDESAA